MAAAQLLLRVLDEPRGHGGVTEAHPVGGAMGAVNGVFGISDRGYRCRGYYDRFHCYR
jgi:hypothetical protein